MVEAEEALRKEKRGKESDCWPPSPFCTFHLCLVCCLELETCTKANEELHKLWELAEAREAATEDKLSLDREARQCMIWKSYSHWVYCIFVA